MFLTSKYPEVCLVSQKGNSEIAMYTPTSVDAMIWISESQDVFINQVHRYNLDTKDGELTENA